MPIDRDYDAEELDGMAGYWTWRVQFDNTKYYSPVKVWNPDWNPYEVSGSEQIEYKIQEVEVQQTTGEMALIDLKDLTLEQLDGITQITEKDLEDDFAAIQGEIDEYEGSVDADRRIAEAKEEPR